MAIGIVLDDAAAFAVMAGDAHSDGLGQPRLGQTSGNARGLLRHMRSTRSKSEGLLIIDVHQIYIDLHHVEVLLLLR